jgi:uncharacterized protein (TIGR03435 family)
MRVMQRLSAWLPIGVAAAVWLAPLAAQTQAPAFDVASVKRAVPGTPGAFIRFLPGGRFVGENVAIQFVIQRVYGVRDFQVIAAPEWKAIIADGFNQRYQIEGRGPESATEAQLKEMVKTLLADRFKLRLHAETRDLPVYALVPDNGGVKPGRDPDGPGGGVLLMLPGWTRFQRVKADALARYLSDILDRPVIDKSNLDRDLNFDLTWTPAEVANAPDAIPGCPLSFQEMAKRLKFDLKNLSCPPSVVTALREQLGFRLEPQLAPTQVIVIDSIQTPSEN